MVLVGLVGIDVCEEVVSKLHDLGLVHHCIFLAEVPFQDPIVELQELALCVKRCNDIRDVNMLCQYSSFLGESERVRIVLGRGKDRECITSCRHMSQRCLGWFIVDDDVVDAGKVNLS